jgi:sigma-B regulation protein RsbU (phosphoserine phosphatase)
MDVQILLRMGTKYLVAKATLVVLEIVIAAFLVLRFIVPMMERKEHQTLTVILSLAAMAGLFGAFLMRDSLSGRLQRWLDRKFFREAYNSEVVLSELSGQARKFTDAGRSWRRYRAAFQRFFTCRRLLCGCEAAMYSICNRQWGWML